MSPSSVTLCTGKPQGASFPFEVTARPVLETLLVFGAVAMKCLGEGTVPFSCTQSCIATCGTCPFSRSLAREIQGSTCQSPHPGESLGLEWHRGSALKNGARQTQDRHQSANKCCWLYYSFISGKGRRFNLAPLPECPPSRADTSLLVHLSIFGVSIGGMVSGC